MGTDQFCIVLYFASCNIKRFMLLLNENPSFVSSKFDDWSVILQNDNVAFKYSVQDI